MKLKLLSLMFLLAIAFGVKAQIITTVAGNGIQGYNGDSIPATSAEIYGAVDLVVDKLGNLYITEQINNRIRKISTNGIITTIAGNGTAGYSGDGGKAIFAEINNPSAITIDNNNNLFIADAGNYRVRKIDSNGIITTVAGNGIVGFSGNGVKATLAEINIVFGLAVDNLGNLYISDCNGVIRKVDSNGIIRIIAGTGNLSYNGDGIAATSANLFGPQHIAVDYKGNVFIADNYNYRIRKVDTSGIIWTVAGNGAYGFSGDGGSAKLASLSNTVGLALDTYGNLYIGDQNNQRIRKVDTKGIITTLVGNGTQGYSGDGGIPTSAELNNPYGIALDALGNLYIADTDNSRIRKISGIVTPITLLKYTTNKQENNILLSWQTATEINTSHFNIQRSTNGKDFTTIGKVNAKGASTYTYNDPLTTDDSRFTKLYYRLQIVDNNGVLSYSEVRELSIVNSQFSITPNPAKDNVTISGTNLKQVKLLDNQCRVVAVKESANSNSVSIPVSHIAKGIYMVQATFKDGSVKTEKVVVE